MCAASLTGPSWALGPEVNPSKKATPHVQEISLRGGAHRLEAAYQAWQAAMRAPTPDKKALSTAPEPAKRTIVFVVPTSALGDGAVPGVPADKRYTLVSLHVNFATMTARLQAVTTVRNMKQLPQVAQSSPARYLQRNGKTLSPAAPPSAAAQASQESSSQPYFTFSSARGAVPFDESISKQLEAAYQDYKRAVHELDKAQGGASSAKEKRAAARAVRAASTLTLQVDNRRYVVDLASMTQQNKASKKKRTVTREVRRGASPSAATPPPPRTSSNAFQQVNVRGGKSRRTPRTPPITSVPSSPPKPQQQSAAAAATTASAAPSHPVGGLAADLLLTKDVPGRWQFSNAARTRWYNMTQGSSAAVEAAFIKLCCKGNRSTATASADDGTVRCGRSRYRVDWSQLTQTNVSSGQVRRIRRVVITPPQDSRRTVAPPASTPRASATAKAADKHRVTTPTSAPQPQKQEQPLQRPPSRDAPPNSSAAVGPAEEAKTFEAAAQLGTVYRDASGPYECMLNKADIQRNNNKFYHMQIRCVHDGPARYILLSRWGRVGVFGQTRQTSYDDAARAVDAFRRQFCKKTGYQWADASRSARGRRGAYILMRIDHRTEAERKAEEEVKLAAASAPAATSGITLKPIAEPPSKLHPQVKGLLEYIADRNDMNSTMTNDFSLDVRRMPLGQITQEQIREAYGVLTSIEAELKQPLPRQPELVALSNYFYTLLPHTVPHHARLPAIDNPLLLQRKIDLLQNLGDLRIANEVMKRATQQAASATAVTEHHLDRMYRNLGCILQPLEEADPIVQRIKLYVARAQGPTHHVVPEVDQVFNVRCEREERRSADLLAQTQRDPNGPFTNRMMLWHGSRKTNFIGILSQGLRIAPPEAPSTGYMFGKGIYFSDVVTKASNYCHPTNNRGLMVLSEVALGRMRLYGTAHFMLQPQKGFASTKGVGEYAPLAAQAELLNGVCWPMGAVRKIDLAKTVVKKTNLLYPEYIIYNPAQYIMRYLISMKFRRR